MRSVRVKQSFKKSFKKRSKKISKKRSKKMPNKSFKKISNKSFKKRSTKISKKDLRGGSGYEPEPEPAGDSDEPVDYYEQDEITDFSPANILQIIRKREQSWVESELDIIAKKIADAHVRSVDGDMDLLIEGVRDKVAIRIADPDIAVNYEAAKLLVMEFFTSNITQDDDLYIMIDNITDFIMKELTQKPHHSAVRNVAEICGEHHLEPDQTKLKSHLVDEFISKSPRNPGLVYAGVNLAFERANGKVTMEILNDLGYQYIDDQSNADLVKEYKVWGEGLFREMEDNKEREEEREKEWESYRIEREEEMKSNKEREGEWQSYHIEQESDVSDLIAENARIKGERGVIDKECARLQEIIDHHKPAPVDDSEEVKELKSSLTKELNRAESAVKEAQSQKTRMEKEMAEVDSLKQTVLQQKNHIADYKLSIKEEEEGRQTAEKKLRDGQLRNTRGCAESERISNEKISELELRNQALNSQISRNEVLVNSIGMLTRKGDSNEGEFGLTYIRNSTNDDLDGLKSELTELDTALRELQVDNTGLQASNAGLQKTNDGLQASNAGLQADNTGLQEKNTGLQETNAGLQATNAGLITKSDTFDETGKSHVSRMKSLNEKASELKSANVLLNTNNKQLQDDIVKLRESKPLTAPDDSEIKRLTRLVAQQYVALQAPCKLVDEINTLRIDNERLVNGGALE